MFILYSITPPSHPSLTNTLLFIQVSHFGCKSFALLFDDIDHNMCPADKEVFSSFAHAQVSITNEIYQYLGEPEIFLFCPTGKIKDCCSFYWSVKEPLLSSLFCLLNFTSCTFQNTVERFATQTWPSRLTCVPLVKNCCLALTFCGQVWFLLIINIHR